MENPLRKAAERLPGHWYQGTYYEIVDGKATGRACGLGHLNEVTTEMLASVDPAELHGAHLRAERLMKEAAAEMFPDRAIRRADGHVAFAFFNDHPETTEEEVVQVLEKAAIKWDEQV